MLRVWVGLIKSIAKRREQTTGKANHHKSQCAAETHMPSRRGA
jgi:hypothetical protein